MSLKTVRNCHFETVFDQSYVKSKRVLTDSWMSDNTTCHDTENCRLNARNISMLTPYDLKVRGIHYLKRALC